MILQDDEALARLENKENLVNVLKNKVTVLPVPHGGMKKGDHFVPPLVRDLLCVTANSSDERQDDIADTFGVHQSTISRNSRGIIAEDQAIEPELVGLANTTRKKKMEDAHGFALDALTSSLANLNNRMSEVDKPEKLSRIASDMSKVISNLATKDDGDEAAKTKIIFFAPNMKVENNYESVEV